MTVLQLAFFVLGTLGPAVKMAAMQGIPWTKARVLMYLASFLVFDGRDAVDGQAVSRILPRIPTPLLASNLDVRSKHLLKIIEAVLVICALFAHARLLIYAVLSLFLSLYLSYSLLPDPKFGMVSWGG